MASTELQRLQAIRSFPSLVKYLRDELDWPIESDDFDELTFDYEPEELGIDSKTAVKIKEIKQLRPLDSHQPWGIFFVNFEPKRLPIVVLRRILRSLVVKKRSMAATAHRATWQLHDLLFISAYGESEHRELTFAHFNEPHDRAFGDLPTLKVLGWDAEDTLLRLDHVVQTLSNKLRWPENGIDANVWREHWSNAFVLRPREVIRTSRELAVKLADLAKSIRNRANVILKYESETGPLRQLHKAFQTALIHDLTQDDFADMYSQTISYGLLAASVSRPMGIIADNLQDMVPITNPFLKEIMGTFLSAGGRTGKIDFDELGIQEIVDLLNSPDTHMEDILRDFGNRTMQEDPVIHFYELFLKEYDHDKKIKRGVFYTPQPVVSYIVRSVHELLQSEFGLEDGLASIVTWGEIARLHKDLKIPNGVTPEQPFVQILDPATGTTTFLVQVIETIHSTMVEKWKSWGRKSPEITNLWNEYVPRHLLPRMYGYELMMAPYAIAHMKIGLKLAETGYDFGSEERVNIYLTNALEPASEIDRQFNLLAELAPALAHEAQAVNEIKRNQRFTVVIGNPPYANFGQMNRNPFIIRLLDDYKLGLEDKKLNLDDDYLKFYRLGQFLVNKSGYGCLGLITNSSFLDGLVHRKMRESLLEQFAFGYVIDLHGSSRRLEKSPDSGTDGNVFEIQQGVAISIFVMSPTGTKQPLKHTSYWGTREFKYSILDNITEHEQGAITHWPRPPKFFFIPQDYSMSAEYESWLPFNSLVSVLGSGLNTDRDDLCIDFDKTRLANRMKRVFLGQTDEDFISAYNLQPSSSYDPVRLANKQDFDESALHVCIYRPFDFRHIYYKVGFTSRPVFDVQGHMLRPNIGLLICRQSKEPFAVMATNFISTHKIVAVYDRTSLAPLWLYPLNTANNNAMYLNKSRRCNFTLDFCKSICQNLGESPNEYGLPLSVLPEDAFRYIYAVFHSVEYRVRYAEFLKTDFPRVPLPRRLDLFRALSHLGGELVSLHLMESSKLDTFITTYTGRDSEVQRVGWSDDSVWLDAAATKKGQPARPGTMGFRGVPEDVWNFHIGGYQVCHKWLKDRKGRTLSEDDINHYQKIVVALKETIRIMGQIDEVIEEHGGWPEAFVGKC